MSPFLRAYFSRLSWTGEPDVSIDTLRELHLQHNSAIPFENLDVLLPREIHLDDGALEEKLIAARRGGYCFEQNGLLERALREIGFNVRSLLGRVVLANPPQMPPRTHRLLLVEVAGELDRRRRLRRPDADRADQTAGRYPTANAARQLSSGA